jgi:hypothetical protein
MSTLPDDYVEWFEKQKPKFAIFDDYRFHIERAALGCAQALLSDPDRETNPASPASIVGHLREAAPYFAALREHYGDQWYEQHFAQYVELEREYL